MTVYTIKNGDVLRWPSLKDCLRANNFEVRDIIGQTRTGPIKQYVKGEREMFIFELDPRECKMSDARYLLAGYRYNGKTYPDLISAGKDAGKTPPQMAYIVERITRDVISELNGPKPRKKGGPLLRAVTHGLGVWR